MSLKTISNNPFLSPEISSRYEDYYQTAGRQVDRQEKALLRKLLNWFEGLQTVLEVGCGTGHFTRWLSDLGLQPIGLDISRPMLDVAAQLGRITYLQADAKLLPFPKGSFDLVSMITTLEFVTEPLQVLQEALRVSRQGLILGVINAKSCLGRDYMRRGGPIWSYANFFVPLRLKQMIAQITGNETDILWRTTLWPLWPGDLPLPWGGFIGMAVKIL